MLHRAKNRKKKRPINHEAAERPRSRKRPIILWEEAAEGSGGHKDETRIPRITSQDPRASTAPSPEAALRSPALGHHIQ